MTYYDPYDAASESAAINATINKQHRVLGVILNVIAGAGGALGLIMMVVSLSGELASAVVGGALLGAAILASLGTVLIDISRDVKRIYIHGDYE